LKISQANHLFDLFFNSLFFWIQFNNKIKKMCQSPQIFWLRPKKLFIFHIFSSLFALLALRNLPQAEKEAIEQIYFLSAVHGPKGPIK